MRHHHSLTLGRKMLLFGLMVDLLTCLSASSSCAPQENKTFDVVEGQNASHNFYLNRPLSKNYSLVWRKRGKNLEVICTHDLQCNRSENSPERYKVIREKDQQNESMITMFIEDAQGDDTGTHVITLHSGSRSKCIILRLNLNIIDPSPSKETLQNNSKTFKMSCKPLDKDGMETALSNIKSDNDYQDIYNSENSFTLLLNFKEILFHTNNSPSRVTYRKNMINQTCRIASSEEPFYPLNDKDNIVFELCDGNRTTHSIWFRIHDNDTGLFNIPSLENHTEFLCKQNSHQKPNVNITGTLNVLGDLNTCTSFIEVSNYSTILKCAKLVLRVPTASTSTQTEVTTLQPKQTSKLGKFAASTGPSAICTLQTKQSRCTTSKTMSPKYFGKWEEYKVILILVASVSIIALGFSVASCFYKYKLVNGRGNIADHRVNFKAAHQDEEPDQSNSSQDLSQHGNMATVILGNPSEATSDNGKHGHGRDQGPASNGCQSETHAKELHSTPSGSVKGHTRLQGLPDLGEAGTSTDKELNNSTPKVIHSEDIYCSLDGSEDECNAETRPSQCLSSLLSKYDAQCEEDAPDVKSPPSSPNDFGNQIELSNPLYGVAPLSSSSGKSDDLTRNEGNHSLSDKELPSCIAHTNTGGKNASACRVLARPEIEALYAKPDKNRKTKQSDSRLALPNSCQAELTIVDMDCYYVNVPAANNSRSSTTIITRKSECIYESCD